MPDASNSTYDEIHVLHITWDNAPPQWTLEHEALASVLKYEWFFRVHSFSIESELSPPEREHKLKDWLQKAFQTIGNGDSQNLLIGIYDDRECGHTRFLEMLGLV